MRKQGLHFPLIQQYYQDKPITVALALHKYYRYVLILQLSFSWLVLLASTLQIFSWPQLSKTYRKITSLTSRSPQLAVWLKSLNFSPEWFNIQHLSIFSYKELQKGCNPHIQCTSFSNLCLWGGQASKRWDFLLSMAAAIIFTAAFKTAMEDTKWRVHKEAVLTVINPLYTATPYPVMKDHVSKVRQFRLSKL